MGGRRGKSTSGGRGLWGGGKGDSTIAKKKRVQPPSQER